MGDRAICFIGGGGGRSFLLVNGLLIETNSSLADLSKRNIA